MTEPALADPTPSTRKPNPRATTLADIRRPDYVVTITYPDGRNVDVELRPLASRELWDLRRTIIWPSAPIKDMTKTGPVYDYQEPGYVAAREDANRLFNLKVLLACLVLEIPGETEADRLTALEESLGQTEFTLLVVAAQRINGANPEEIAAVANSFRRV